MRNFQNAFLVTMREENGTYHYKNTNDLNFMTFNKFFARLSSFVVKVTTDVKKLLK